jgi:hypothetical protein
MYIVGDELWPNPLFAIIRNQSPESSSAGDHRTVPCGILLDNQQSPDL